jgi:hypothetical protein
MERASVADTKRGVCRALTEAIRESPLGQSIDPKGFFTMVSNNYELLQDGQGIQLAPVWDALVQAHAPDTLSGLFLKMQASVEALGVAAKLPPAVERLSDRERNEALASHQAPPVDRTVGSQLMEVLGEHTGDVRFDPNEAQNLRTDDLYPVVSEEQRKALIRIVLDAVRIAPVGQRVNGTQLGFHLDANFFASFDGRVFHFDPLLAVLGAESASPEEVYATCVAIRHQLTQRSVPCEVPDLGLSAAKRTKIEEEILNSILTRSTGSLRDPANASQQHTTGNLGEKASSRKRHGELPDERTRKQRRAVVQSAAGLLVVGAIGAFGYLTRPNRHIDLQAFANTVPLLSAQMKQGTFSASLDEKAWYAMPPEAREKAVAAFGAMVVKKGLVRDMQVFDAKGRVVMMNPDGKRVVAAPIIMKGAGPQESPTPEKPRQPPRPPEKSPAGPPPSKS